MSSETSTVTEHSVFVIARLGVVTNSPMLSVYVQETSAIAWCKSTIEESTIHSRKAVQGDIEVTSPSQGVTEVVRNPQGNTRGFRVVQTPFTRFLPAPTKAKSEPVHIVHDPESGEVLWATDSPDEAARIRRTATSMYEDRQYQYKKLTLFT